MEKKQCSYDDYFDRKSVVTGVLARAAANNPFPVTEPVKAPKKYLKRTRDAWNKFMYHEINAGILALEDLVFVEMMFDSLDLYYRNYEDERFQTMAKREFSSFNKSAIRFCVSKKEREQLR